MQNWKIKRMKDGELRANIDACSKFLRTYTVGNYRSGLNCLFCQIVEGFHPRVMRYFCDRPKRCNFCLWKIVEGETCEQFSSRNFSESVVSIKDQPGWGKVRIPMLRRWKKILKAELARREL